MPILIFLIAASFAAAQTETAAEIRRAIKDVNAEAEREKTLTQTEAKRHAAYVENSKQKMVSIAEQEKSLHAQIDSLSVEIQSLQAARQKALGTARYFENRKTKYGEDLAKVIDSLALFEKNDFPYKNEDASTALKEIAADLRKTIISAEAAFGRAWELLLERARLGYTAEVWSGNLELEGRTVSGKFFRYGAVAMLFISQNGEEILWRNAENNYKWHSAGNNIALRAALKETMRVAEGKTAPKLVLMPIPAE